MSELVCRECPLARKCPEVGSSPLELDGEGTATCVLVGTSKKASTVLVPYGLGISVKNGEVEQILVKRVVIKAPWKA